ncbi:hypothetical protein EV363DRAFT_1218888 [Boletus edulis]|nr:hypothetical protein EV363DRAFT_1218888 [Boletus edulis]
MFIHYVLGNAQHNDWRTNNYIHIPKMGKYMSETSIQRNGNENGTKPYIYAGTTRAIGMR